MANMSNVYLKIHLTIDYSSKLFSIHFFSLFCFEIQINLFSEFKKLREFSEKPLIAMNWYIQIV